MSHPHNDYPGRRQSRNTGRDRLATGLGWFSIGLGLAEILLPREVARLVGVRGYTGIFAALGARELLTGVGILAQKRPAGWLWSRVAGDIVDLSLLGAAFRDDTTDRDRVEIAAGAVGGILVADLVCAIQVSRDRRPVHVEKVIAVDRSREQLYSFWRKLENLPRFMRHLESVRQIGQNRSHWSAIGPADTRFEWDAEIVTDHPDELISWRSLPGADVENSGSVRFDRAPGDRGTFVRVTMEYLPPAGIFGASVAKLLGDDPETLVQRDLYRFKQIMETGEVTTTEGQPAARSSSTSAIYDTDNAKK